MERYTHRQGKSGIRSINERAGEHSNLRTFKASTVERGRALHSPPGQVLRDQLPLNPPGPEGSKGRRL